MSQLRDFQSNLPMALLKARESVMGRFRPILRAHDITEQQWRVIRALHGHEGMEVTALAQKCMILMPSLTRILKTLEAQDFVKRFSVQGDNRRALIRLAAKGRELHSKIAPLSEAEYKRLESAIGSEKLSQLYELLGAIADTDNA
ncbi:MAG: homoprotocatechuate degradation operon regulator HpaR [Maricaulaceae bacterium]